MSARTPALSVVRQFQSETDAIREEPEPRWARMTIFVLVGLLVSCLAIMTLTRVDRVVTSTRGKIVPTQNVNVLQPLDQSIIRTLDVREGERVQAGQLLATLDPTFTEANFKQLHQQIASLRTLITRIEAELGNRLVSYPETSDADYSRYAAMQTALYQQRIAQYKAQIESYDAKFQQLEATIRKLETDQVHYQHRQEIAKSIEEMRATLAKSGSGSLLNLYISQDARIEVLRALESSHNSLIEARHTLSSLRADRDAFAQQWSTQLSQDLVIARNNLDLATAQFEKAAKLQQLVRLVAPEQSIVLTVAKLSVGSVLRAGDPLITLMPVNTPVEAEAHISARDIGFVRPGDRCVLKVDAFNYIAHGTAEGTVRWISAGAFTVDDDGKPVEAYYKTRCGVDATHFTGVPENFQLIPGMTLTADIKIGTRSVVMYLLEGVLRGFDESMREP